MVSTPLSPAQIASKLALTATTIDTFPQGQVWVACVAGRITGGGGEGVGGGKGWRQVQESQGIIRRLGRKWANINLLKERPLG